MRKNLYLLLLLITIKLVYCGHSFAQTAGADSSSQPHAFKNALSTFNASLGEQSRLYNGIEYYYYDPSIKSNAYFKEVNGFTQGSVFYDGALYNGARLLYDLYTDKLVVLLYNNYSKFSLIKEKVKYFDFLDHHFVNISTDTIGNNSSGIKSGYYDELYNGKTQALVRRTKSIQSTTSGTTGIENYFTPSNDYYVRKNRVYYSISGQGSLLDVLKDKKKELEQYIKSSQIKFRKDPDDAMVKILSYYDRLTN